MCVEYISPDQERQQREAYDREVKAYEARLAADRAERRALAEAKAAEELRLKALAETVVVFVQRPPQRKLLRAA